MKSGLDLENHKYTDGWGVAFFKYTKVQTPILIEFNSDNSFCTDFVAYYGLFDRVETITSIDIVHSTGNYIKYKHINHRLLISEYDKTCVPLYSNNSYINKYDIYTGKSAIHRLEFYKNLNLVSE